MSIRDQRAKKALIEVGYWFSKSPENQQYPPAVARVTEWPGKWEFLKALRVVEAATSKRHYKGWSTCRICGCENGSSDHTYNGFRWPDGFDHYIEVHNVKPPLAFRDMVKRAAYELLLKHDEEHGNRPAMKRALTKRPVAQVELLDEKEVRKLQRLLQSHLRVEFAQGEFKFTFAGTVVAQCSMFR